MIRASSRGGGTARVRGALLLALLLAHLDGCGTKRDSRPPRVSVTVARVEVRSVPYEIEATGTVEAQQTVEILAQIGGTIERVAFREGDAVAQGQVLIQLDARPFRAALEQAAAVLARDRALAEQARREAERARSLREQSLISAGEHEDKQMLAASREATVRADSASWTQAGLNFQYATIRAPIAGRTGSLSAHVGDVVRANDLERPLVTINQLRPVRVRFTVPQDALPAVLRSRGRPLPVLASTADRDTFEHQGHFVFVDNAVDAGTGTLLLKGEFANRDEALWPGEFVRVRLVLSSQADAIVVPSVAVTSSPGGPIVYVLGPDSTVSVRPVTVERTRGDVTVIARGLERGETVVTDGQLRLSDGARAVVRPALGTEATPGARAGAAGAADAAAGGGAGR